MAYVWSDETKQQYYYSTGTVLQYLINELSEQSENLPHIEFFNKLYNGIVYVLKDCNAIHYKRFTVEHKTNFQWTHALNDLKKLSKDAVHGWCSVGCPVNGPEKESLAEARRDYKKAIKAAKNEYKRI